MKNMKLGTDLTPAQQRAVLAAYLYRSTDETPGGGPTRQLHSREHPVQFKDDADWLAHTSFAVTKSGELSRRNRYCQSNPTWPFNPELRK